MKAFAIVALSLFAAAAQAHPGHHDHGRFCGQVFQGAGFTGEAISLYEGGIVDLEKVRLGHTEYNWNNRISSARVEAGCSLALFQYKNFGRHYSTGQAFGGVTVYGTSSVRVEAAQVPADNEASSLTCYCN